MAEHGTVNMYVNKACRCGECKEAWRIDGQSRRAIRREKTANGQVGGTHGKATTYSNWSCRCMACTAAWRDYHAERRAAKRDS